MLDLRLALLLMLLGRCFGDDLALALAGGEGLVVEVLRDSDARVRHHAASFLQVQSGSFPTSHVIAGMLYFRLVCSCRILMIEQPIRENN